MDINNNGHIIFQQYKSRFQKLLINDSNKILKINEGLEKKRKLADVRLEFDHMKSIATDVDDEPSSKVIGLLEINLSKN